jgi:DNA-binding NtrC family response regulator
MLLRVLQEREVRPLGSIEARRVDVRVIAATNRDLEDALRERAFRADLLDRLGEIVLEVPPLCERREDIPLLIEHFLTLQSRRHGLQRPPLDRTTLAALRAFDWPGNVRELQRVIGRLVVLGSTSWPGRHGLPLRRATRRMRNDVGPRGPRRRRHDEVAQRVLQLAGNALVRRRDVMQELGISGERARQLLARLVQRGDLQRIGAGRATRYLLLPSATTEHSPQSDQSTWWAI